MIYFVLEKNLKQLLGFREKRKKERTLRYSVKKLCRSRKRMGITFVVLSELASGG